MPVIAGSIRGGFKKFEAIESKSFDLSVVVARIQDAVTAAIAVSFAISQNHSNVKIVFLIIAKTQLD